MRPLLAKRCYSCHSAKTEKLKGGLRLDSRSLLLKGGDTGPAAVPGKPGESLLVDAINYGEVYQMPPKSRLPEKEVAVLTRWVAEGLAWPPGDKTAGPDSHDDFDLARRKADHWCWQPIRRQRIPRVSNRDWPSQPLDFFILHRLEQEKLVPADPTDRQSLLRRASFDLTGLPPTPAEVTAFISDKSPSAFATVVDRLLDSPHFGERWARHWMDLARYAESHGHEFDYPIHNAFQYRDYLIRAFNADVPYDRFITEHLAGDLLPDPRRNPLNGINESVIATGFWYLGEATHSPVDVLGDQASRVDNQLDVMAKSFLGITLACARCHDHKFDAISTRDYYSMFGYLQSSRRNTALLDPDGKIKSHVDQLTRERKTASDLLETHLLGEGRVSAADFKKYLLAAREIGFGTQSDHATVAAQHALDTPTLKSLSDYLLSEATLAPGHPLHLWRRTAEKSATDVQAVAAAVQSEDKRRAAEIEAYSESSATIPISTDTGPNWMPHGQAFPASGPARLALDLGPPHLVPGNQLHSGVIARKLEGSIRSPLFTLTHKNIHLHLKGSGVTVRLIIEGYYMDEFNALLFRGFKQNIKDVNEFSWRTLGSDVGRYVGHQGYLEVIDHGGGYVAIDEVRQSNGGPPPAGPGFSTRLLTGALDNTTHEEIADAYTTWWKSLPQRWAAGTQESLDISMVNAILSAGLLPLAADLGASQKRYTEAASGIPGPMKVLAIADGDGHDQSVYIRGNPHILGDQAPRGFLTALSDPDTPLVTGPGSGRLALAREVASADNPLTSRVIVNRVWHHLFGRGLVATVDNFGVLGETPSHPRLLDYLSMEFTGDGWSIKRLLRRIMLSSSYRMSSHADPRQRIQDPGNLLLHHANVRRLQGEVIRDAILAVSGRLDGETLYGPPVPIHITPFMTGRGRPGGSGPLDGNGRRSIYIAIRRNFLSPMMLAFDTPIPFNSMGRRNVSNVPSQSLIMMNDPFVIQQAALWGGRISSLEAVSREERVRQMYLEALSRYPTPGELEQSIAFLVSQAAEYGVAPDQLDSEPRLWSDLGHVLFNMKSFVFLY
ncbi:MAG: PSD1 and planctomycete cytochrome C domain-containing protein [Planctomycetota bacterium]|nr:PSD1 and planctomycete cytochrome C domain-containing protein [Planctomycetota bacterium]